VAIPGASRVDQARGNVTATDLRLGGGELARLDRLQAVFARFEWTDRGWGVA
jgi:aryl-alcohol dehydrogenase-like predicted oxidoreductase